MHSSCNISQSCCSHSECRQHPEFYVGWKSQCVLVKSFVWVVSIDTIIPYIIYIYPIIPLSIISLYHGWLYTPKVQFLSMNSPCNALIQCEYSLGFSIAIYKLSRILKHISKLPYIYCHIFTVPCIYAYEITGKSLCRGPCLGDHSRCRTGGHGPPVVAL